MTSWQPGLCYGCGAEWSGCILSIVLKLESTEHEVGWKQLVREVKENPQVSDVCIWADGGGIY